ncbi:MAG: VacJ family lipoprotein [Sphingomonadaceae bacterium]
MIAPVPLALMLAHLPNNLAAQQFATRILPPSTASFAPPSANGSAAGAINDAPPQTKQAATETAPPPSNIIIVTGHEHSKIDPLRAVNIKTFKAAQKVDSVVIAPVAKGYQHDIPHPLRSGLHNFLENLHEPVVAVNFVLQHRVGKALGTVARFAINSTIGAAGLFDIAKRKPFNLPYRPNGFADTMGFYGVKPGAYMFLPIIGPTTVRDLAGYILDKAALPVAIGAPFSKPTYTVPTGIISALDKRVTFNDELEKIHKSASPYYAMRTYYLKQRREEIASLHTKSKHRDKPTDSK